MKRFISLMLAAIFAFLAPATAFAWERYSSYYHSGHHGYYPHYYGHSHDDFLAPLGVGLLTGAVIGSILFQPPVERTVVYAAPPVIATPPPVIVQSRPMIVQPQSRMYPDQEVLRQVRPTVRSLNLRSGPGLDEEIIGQATGDEPLGVIGAAPEWLYIKTSRGQYGWVMTQYTQALDGPSG
jgi:hypothetical protein